MKRKLVIMSISILIFTGCNLKNNNVNEIDNKTQNSEIKEEIKTIDIKINNKSILAPFLVDNLLKEGLKSYSEDVRVDINKCNIGDNIFSENGDKVVLVDYCNYSNNVNTVKYSTITKMEIDSDIIIINDVIVDKTTYEEVIKKFGKDSKIRLDSYDEERKNGEVKLMYWLNDNNNEKNIALEFLFNNSGIVSKVIYIYKYVNN